MHVLPGLGPNSKSPSLEQNLNNPLPINFLSLYKGPGSDEINELIVESLISSYYPV